MKKSAVLVAAAAALFVSSAAQATVIFDDYEAGVSWKLDWGNVNTSNVYSGAQSVQAWAGNSQIVLKAEPPSGSPITIGSSPILDFWLNTVSNEAVTLHIRISTPSMAVEYSWNGGDTYDVDGVVQVGGLTSDASSATWQHVKFDVTQLYDWYAEPTYGSGSLAATDQISVIQISGSANTLVDAVQMTAVPEPAALGLIGTGALLALRRRRA